ncbi:MAG: electron transfer flavoprotein subunit beta/FixA family protein [Ignavibacteriales bacterium]|nr:electron transfer flavoprotein subunit beta/FixA family protein [Ignavibacteriales bacterium]
MNIAVCVNHVPDTATKIKLTPDGTAVDLSGASFIVNPYDEFAIEEALKAKDKTGGTLYVISLGPDTNNETIRKALAMGADEGVLIKSTASLDSMAVAENLAHYIKELQCDLVFSGKQSVDYDNGVVPQLIAEYCDYNCIPVCVSFELNGSAVKAESEIEGGREVIETSLPVIIAAQKGLNEPRYASLKGIMAAKKKVIREVPTINTSVTINCSQYSLPAPKAAGRIIGNDASAVRELVKLLHEEAKVI